MDHLEIPLERDSLGRFSFHIADCQDENLPFRAQISFLHPEYNAALHVGDIITAVDQVTTPLALDVMTALRTRNSCVLSICRPQNRKRASSLSFDPNAKASIPLPPHYSLPTTDGQHSFRRVQNDHRHLVGPSPDREERGFSTTSHSSAASGARDGADDHNQLEAPGPEDEAVSYTDSSEDEKQRQIKLTSNRRAPSPPSPPVHMYERPPSRRRRSHDMSKSMSPSLASMLNRRGSKPFVLSAEADLSRRRSSEPLIDSTLVSFALSPARSLETLLTPGPSLDYAPGTPLAGPDKTPTNTPRLSPPPGSSSASPARRGSGADTASPGDQQRRQSGELLAGAGTTEVSTETDLDISDCSESSTTSSTSNRERWTRVMRLKRACRVFEKASYPWVQLAGHKGGFRQDLDERWILKAATTTEEAVFDYFRREEPQIFSFVPLYGGTVNAEDRRFLKLQNLLYGLENPRIIDIKMGTRTFLESETNAVKLRKDLLAKMDDIDPRAATPEERDMGITKMRYMVFREQQSSSASLGFRIEAISVNGQQNKGFKTLKARSDIIRHFEFFLQKDAYVRDSIVSQLIEMKRYLLTSPFFNCHEIVGSSILIVTGEDGTSRVSMIDFGKTVRRETRIHHDKDWEPNTGSYEDGYLIGFNNMMSLLRACSCK